MDGAKIFWTAYSILMGVTDAAAKHQDQQGHPELANGLSELSIAMKDFLEIIGSTDEAIVDDDVPTTSSQDKHRQWEYSNRLDTTEGYYVYSLRWWGVPFYIGKGKNRRMHAHVNGAMSGRDDSNEVKKAIILNMHNIGAVVEETIERWFDNEEFALAYEQELINNCPYPLANIAGNYHSKYIDMDYVNRVFANDKKAQEAVHAGLR